MASKVNEPINNVESPLTGSTFNSVSRKIIMGKKVEKGMKGGKAGSTMSTTNSNPKITSAQPLTTLSSFTQDMTSKLKGSGSKSSLGSSKQAGQVKPVVITEPHKCTGRFKEDFENMCVYRNVKYIPDVLTRSKRPGSALQNAYLTERAQNIQQQNNELGGNASSMNRGMNAKDSKTAASSDKSKNKMSTAQTTNYDTENEMEQNPEFFDMPPKSFVIKEPAEYYKPKIHVEMENPDKLDTVTEVFIKGWKLEKSIFDVLAICFPAVETLQTLNLWNAGLDEDMVRAISNILPTCSNLKTLIMDNNPIATPVYHILLYEKSSNVQNISLRNNQLDDVAIDYISFGLGDLKNQNTKIQSLNLSSNKITDVGAIALARALRTNRTLLVLNLACNRIGDQGAKAFSDVISRFALTFEEICYRRLVMSGRLFETESASPTDRKGAASRDIPSSLLKSPAHALLADTKNARKDKTLPAPPKTKSTPGAGENAAVSATLPANKGSAGEKSKTSETLSKTKAGRKASMADGKNSKLKSKGGAKLTKKDLDELNAHEDDSSSNKAFSRASSFDNVLDFQSAMLELSPLADVAEYVNENLYLIGNRALISLNLSRNYLTDESVKNFLLALQYQKTFMDIHKTQDPGLLRLILTRNDLTSESESNLKRLNDMLKQRDPIKQSATQTLGTTNEPEASSGKDSSLGRTTNRSKN